jgi:hypothetical protein
MGLATFWAIFFLKLVWSPCIERVRTRHGKLCPQSFEEVDKCRNDNFSLYISLTEIYLVKNFARKSNPEEYLPIGVYATF